MDGTEPIGIRLVEPPSKFEAVAIAIVTRGVPGYDAGAYRITWLEADGAFQPESHDTANSLREILRKAFRDGQTVIRDVRGIERAFVERELEIWQAERANKEKL